MLEASRVLSISPSPRSLLKSEIDVQKTYHSNRMLRIKGQRMGYCCASVHRFDPRSRVPWSLGPRCSTRAANWNCQRHDRQAPENSHPTSGSHVHIAAEAIRELFCHSFTPASYTFIHMPRTS